MEKFKTRYSYGGDEFIFVELSEEFSLETIFRVIAITRQIKSLHIEGIYDVCPANASYMVRYNPDIILPENLVKILQEIEAQIIDLSDIRMQSRLVEIPIYFEDPWTHATVMKFRDRHQDPEASDLEYCARINGYVDTKSFIEAMTSAPYLTINVGFVPGLPWCYQLVPREKQIEVPKYVRPRTETPERSFAFAGAFALFYPTAGTGGAQLFGITPTPVFDKNQQLKDFEESMVFPVPGDIYKFRSITSEEYEEIRKSVENGTFEYQKQEFSFSPIELLNDLDGFAQDIQRRFLNA